MVWWTWTFVGLRRLLRCELWFYGKQKENWGWRIPIKYLTGDVFGVIVRYLKTSLDGLRSNIKAARIIHLHRGRCFGLYRPRKETAEWISCGLWRAVSAHKHVYALLCDRSSVHGICARHTNGLPQSHKFHSDLSEHLPSMHRQTSPGIVRHLLRRPAFGSAIDADLLYSFAFELFN